MESKQKKILLLIGAVGIVALIVYLIVRDKPKKKRVESYEGSGTGSQYTERTTNYELVNDAYTNEDLMNYVDIEDGIGFGLFERGRDFAEV